MNGQLDGFVARPYPDIVRDVLTTLTGGTVREPVVVPPGDVLELRLLADRPIRRVSHLEGVVEVTRRTRADDGSTLEEAVEVPYRFTDADYELFATGSAGAENDAIRFRPTGRRPPVGSTVTVNYYPTQTRPAPLTDVNVGSVVRTMLESVARELALVELQLEHVYRSAFVETADGISLDKVVALVGVTRRPSGVPTVPVRFSRAPGSTGRIAIPVGTVVADADDNRYATTAPLVLEPGEPSRQVLAAAVSTTVAAVPRGAIDRMEVLVAGVSAVTNDVDAAASAPPETDAELRRRAQGALAVAARGTLDALRFGLLSVPGVKAVTVTEFPNGLPGEIAVDVAYERDDDTVARDAVAERIDDLRPAGIRVLSSSAAPADVTVTATLTLAGGGVPDAELPTLEAGLEARVVAHVASLPPGGTLRQAQVVTAALTDPRIVDASFEFGLGDTASGTVTAPAGAVLRPVQPFRYVIGSETGAAAAGVHVQVDVFLPVHLAPGVRADDAESALRLAVESWARGVGVANPITVDSLLAAVRDDTRYALVRADTTVTTEAAGRFLHLADGLGSHALGEGDTVEVRTVSVDVREGGV